MLAMRLGLAFPATNEFTLILSTVCVLDRCYTEPPHRSSQAPHFFVQVMIMMIRTPIALWLLAVVLISVERTTTAFTPSSSFFRHRRTHAINMMSTTQDAANTNTRKNGAFSTGIESLYSSEDAPIDPSREYRRKMVMLSVSRPARPSAKTDKERQLDAFLMGEWKLKVSRHR